MVLGQNYIHYSTDEILTWANDSRIKRELSRWRLFWRALRHFDVIHFNFGQTIFPSWKNSKQPISFTQYICGMYRRLFDMQDLELLHRAGKAIVVTYQGDDARQGDYSLAHFDVCIARDVEAAYYDTPSGDVAKRRAIEKFSRYADRVFYLNPDLGWVLPGRAQFMPYAHIDLREWGIAPRCERQGPLTVLHAPTNRAAKGTRYILDAVDHLRREGVAVELLLVEGVRHDEARQAYLRADVLVDQLLAGWYGGLAVELMALGKPVICYVRESDLRFIPDRMREELPIINATPATLYGVLKAFLTTRRHELEELGRRGRAYVEAWHDSRKIAGQLKREYETILTSRQKKGSS